MDYKRIIEKLENHEELTKDEELAAQLALVHLPIPYRTRANVIKHLKKIFKQTLDADSCMMGVPMDSIKRAQLAIKFARSIFAKGCPESGCITHDSEGWRIISNKTGKKWPQVYKTKESAESALKAYHAHQASSRTDMQKFASEPDKPKKVTEIADAIRRDNPDVSDEQAYRMAWETYCSYTNPSYEGCTSKGKSKRKSPKSEY